MRVEDLVIYVAAMTVILLLIYLDTEDKLK